MSAFSDSQTPLKKSDNFITILTNQQNAIVNIEYNLAVTSTSGVTQRGNPDSAIQSLKESIKSLTPGSYLYVQFNLSLASLQVMTGDLDGAKQTYQIIKKSSPNNIILNTFLAGFSLIWDKNNVEKKIEQLESTGWKDAKHYTKAIHIASQSFAIKVNEMTDTSNNTIIGNILNQKNGSGLALVILGYALNEDGSIDPTLVDRLKVTLKAFNYFPQSRIIVSGSDPRGGVTEAYQMSRWLIKEGVPEDHIILEDQSKSTIWNAINSINAIQKMNNLVSTQQHITNIILISSSAHIRRATADFKQALENQNLLTKIGLYNLAYPSPGYDTSRPITTWEKALIIRDTLLTAGLWAMPGMVR